MAEVSVVIPAYNARAGLARCLASLQHSTVRPEVVVIDDGSVDGTQDAVRAGSYDLELRYLYKPRGPESGRAAARNHGLRAATGDVVLFVDADEIVPVTLVEEHLRYHRIRPDTVVLGPRGYLPPTTTESLDPAKPFRPADFPDRVDSDARDQILAALSDNLNDLATCWHYLFTCNASVPRPALTESGGFDEGFTGWGLEDSELGYRLRRRGLAFAYNPLARIYHQHRQAMTPQMYDEWCRNLRYFYDRHPTAEVAAQDVLRGALDPVRRSLPWLEAALRFEYATRALGGRLPDTAAPCAVVDVVPENLDTVLRSIGDRARTGNLVIFDHVGDPHLHAVVQCTTTDHDLSYFARPSAEARGNVLAVLAGRDHTEHPTQRGTG